MKTYKATIIGDRYPMTFQTEASSWATATARLVRQYQKRFKGSRADQLSIKVVRVSQ